MGERVSLQPQTWQRPGSIREPSEEQKETDEKKDGRYSYSIKEAQTGTDSPGTGPDMAHGQGMRRSQVRLVRAITTFSALRALA